MIQYAFIAFGIAFIVVPFFGLPAFIAGIGYALIVIGCLYYFTHLI